MRRVEDHEPEQPGRPGAQRPGCEVGAVPEIDLDAIEALPGTTAGETLPDVRSVTFSDGRTVHVLGSGHMVNLAGPGARGNSIQSMDIGFSLQTLCLAQVATGAVGPQDCVVPVPRAVDVAVAEGYLALKGME